MTRVIGNWRITQVSPNVNRRISPFALVTLQAICSIGLGLENMGIGFENYNRCWLGW